MAGAKTKKVTPKHATSEMPEPFVIRAANGVRVRKLNRKLKNKKVKKDQKLKKLQSPLSLLKISVRHIFNNKKLFFGLLALYTVLYFLFVKGLGANLQLNTFRQNLEGSEGSEGTLSDSVTLYRLLLGTVGSGADENAGVYQIVLFVVFSLAIIWALRMTHKESTHLRVRDALYKGMSQLVPFVTVLFFVTLHCVPGIFTLAIYSNLSIGGYLATGAEQLLALIVLSLGIYWSLYLLSSSLFALYIVTLDGTAPMYALKAAKKLVVFRRFKVSMQLLFLPFVIGLLSAVLLIPLIIVFAPLAEIVFIFYSVFMLAFIHSYIYNMYRNLL